MQYLKDCRIEARYHSIILSDLSFTLSFLLLQPISCASLNTSKDAIDRFYFQGGLLAHIQLGPLVLFCRAALPVTLPGFVSS